jgi:hypothetical protein
MSSTRFSLYLFAAMGLAGCQEPNAPVTAATSSPTPASAEPAASPKPAADVAVVGADLASLDAEKPQAAVICNLESANNVLFSAGPMVLKPGDTVRGWLGHDVPATLEMPVILVRDAHGTSVAAVGIERTEQRDDVVAANGGREDLRVSGFVVAVPELQAGTYALVLRYRVGEQAFVCDNGRQIRID